MTHNDKMPNVHSLLEVMDSDPRAHLLAAALPSLIAAGIRAWDDDYFRATFSLEQRVAATMNAVAVELEKHVESLK